MRTFVRLILLFVSFPLLVCAARAQPALQTDRDARCKAAADKFIAVVSDKAHRTVEEQYGVEYREGIKYLRICGEQDDGFTRSVKQSVKVYEAARSCEVTTWPQYSKRVNVEDSAAPARRKEAYEAAKEFLQTCGRYDIQSTWHVMRLVEDYEAAVRLDEAEKTLASLVPAARAAAPAATEPETYARIAEAYAVAIYKPAQRRFSRLYEPLKPESKELREARAQLDAALDRVIDAYARAIASCGERDTCRASKASWESSLTVYYAFRHGGERRGLEETISRAFDAPMPNL